MKKLNKKGFLLVETLIVSIFIMSIFSLLYTNVFPLVGEYNRVRSYNTTESIYIAHWARKLALNGLPDTVYNQATSDGYVNISDCSLYSLNGSSAWCYRFKEYNKIENIYLVTYQTSTFKTYIDNSSLKRSFKEYVDYLPTYAKNTTKTAANGYYRVIVEYKYDNASDDYYYGTIEVRKL